MSSPKIFDRLRRKKERPTAGAPESAALLPGIESQSHASADDLSVRSAPSAIPSTKSNKDKTFVRGIASRLGFSKPSSSVDPGPASGLGAPPRVHATEEDTLGNPVVQDGKPSRSTTPGQVDVANLDPPSTPDAQPLARPEESTTEKILRRTKGGVITALELVDKAADAFPPLKSAVGGVLALINLADTTTGNKKEFEELDGTLTNISETLAASIPKLKEMGGVKTLERFDKSIRNMLDYTGQKEGRPVFDRIIAARQDKETIPKLYRDITMLFQQYQVDIDGCILDLTYKHYMGYLFDRLSPVDDACYNSGYSETIGRGSCLANTREAILKDLVAWALDPTGAKVYWLDGMAGTGKTTISVSLCKRLEAEKRLAANYFCSRTSAKCQQVHNIIPSLAYQLARYSPDYRPALFKILQETPDAATLNLQMQFDKLIRQPLCSMKSESKLNTDLVVLIDALDECERSRDFGVKSFLEELLRHAKSLPIRFLVTSRPEPGIRDTLQPSMGLPFRVDFHLHEVEASIVEEDITMFLKDALERITAPPNGVEQLGEIEEYITPAEIQQLVYKAGKLFIFAATAVRYISPTDLRVDHRARLEMVLSTAQGEQINYMDELYHSVLTMCCDGLEKAETIPIQAVIWTVVCAREPMTIVTLASILGRPKSQIKRALESLRSILHVQEGTNGIVSTFHASFHDFVFGQCSLPPKLDPCGFHCNKRAHGARLAEGCFKVMRDELCFNICHLESSFAFDKDIPDLEKRIETSISSALSYASRFWADHLLDLEASGGLHEQLVEFLENQLLFWMEVMNLKKLVSMGADMLEQVQPWVAQIEKNDDTEMEVQVADALAFIQRFASGTCKLSTPHIYISMLSYCRRSSCVYENYWKKLRGLIAVQGSTTEAWEKDEMDIISVWLMHFSVGSVAYSSDGDSIACGLEDGTVHVRNARSGDPIIQPFSNHTNKISSVAFSPDNTLIASGSEDETIQVWRSANGEIVAVFEHDDSVTAVAFSPDGTKVISGSDNGAIQLWDVGGQKKVDVEFGGHTERVWSIMFYHNLIISLSHHATCTWDACSGAAIDSSIKVERKFTISPSHITPIPSMQGITGIINYVDIMGDSQYSRARFSPDGSLFVLTTSDPYKVTVWETTRGAHVATFHGHTDYINTLAFSPDGGYLISGSNDCTIRLWDLTLRKSSPRTEQPDTDSSAHRVDNTSLSPVLSSPSHTPQNIENTLSQEHNSPPQPHTKQSVRCAAFFHRHPHIAICGGEPAFIQVWDIATGKSCYGHFNLLSTGNKAFYIVAVSTDDSIIASDSVDGMFIHLWDVASGLAIRELKGRNESIYSLAFSSDGQHLIAGCADSTVGIWSVADGEMIGRLEGHQKSVLAVAISPDGRWIASGSRDKTVRIWDATSHQPVGRPLAGHIYRVSSVAFSPDSTWLVSGSCDKMIRVWNVCSGDLVARPFTGHTDYINSVAFSPNGKFIASASWDKTIRIWSSSGDAIAILQGHTSFVYPVAFSPDGSQLLSGSWDGTARVWDVPSIVCDSPPKVTDGFQQAIVREDGWIGTDKEVFCWVPPSHLKTSPIPPFNTAVISKDGFTITDYNDLAIGERWIECNDGL